MKTHTQAPNKWLKVPEMWVDYTTTYPPLIDRAFISNFRCASELNQQRGETDVVSLERGDILLSHLRADSRGGLMSRKPLDIPWW